MPPLQYSYSRVSFPPFSAMLLLQLGAIHPGLVRVPSLHLDVLLGAGLSVSFSLLLLGDLILLLGCRTSGPTSVFISFSSFSPMLRLGLGRLL